MSTTTPSYCGRRNQQRQTPNKPEPPPSPLSPPVPPSTPRLNKVNSYRQQPAQTAEGVLPSGPPTTSRCRHTLEWPLPKGGRRRCSDGGPLDDAPPPQPSASSRPCGTRVTSDEAARRHVKQASDRAKQKQAAVVASPFTYLKVTSSKRAERGSKQNEQQSSPQAASVDVGFHRKGRQGGVGVGVGTKREGAFCTDTADDSTAVLYTTKQDKSRNQHWP